MITRDFDPLSDLYGQWTTELAEMYLPIPEAAPGTSFECVDGYLVMSPYEGPGNGYAMLELAVIFREGARAAGFHVYPTVNMRFTPQTWIQPDLTILRAPAKGSTWVDTDEVLLVGEIVSPSSKRRDRIDKPAMCAEAKIPFFLLVEFSRFDIHVELLRLTDGEYVSHAKAMGGQLLESDVPFPMKFDPAALRNS
jgi:Uma2 family endonuclease